MRMFYHALAALVFVAACAWSAAALYTGLDVPDMPDPTPELSMPPAPCRFQGLLIRREERLPAGVFPGIPAGTRLSAAETGTESALFFPDSDGWEKLTPADAQLLTPEKLEDLLGSEAPNSTCTPRLVYGFTLFCAALADEDAAFTPGSCRLTLDSVEGGIEADILSVTSDALGRCMLLLRLTQFPETLYEMRVVTGEILS